MATPQSKIFKKAQAGNFKSILKKQKEQESDPKFAISDSLQEFQSQLETSAGYTNQMKLDKANIRQDIINFVIDYTVSDLDQLKGMDYDEAKTQQQTTEKSIKEFEGLYSKGVLNDEEIIYIKETVGKTNAELKKILGVATKLSLSFRDFKKELKPLKLAKRIGLTNVPIIGKKIERAIESEERAEAKGLSVKRALRKKEKKSELKEGNAGKASAGTTAGREDIAKDATAGSLGMDLMPGDSGLADKEEQVEQERESDKQFDKSSNLLEKIYEESKLTNELLGETKKESSGLLGGIATSLLAGGAIAGAIGAMRASMALRLATLGNTLRSAVGLPLNKVNQKTNRAMVNQANEKKTKTRIRTTTGSRVGAVGSTMTGKELKSSMKTSNLVAANKKKGMKVAMSTAGKAVRAGGRFLWPVAALMSVFDAASGVANAGELLGKEDEDLTFKDKASAGFAGFLSGLTFGLVDKEKMAKKFAGDGPTAEEIEATQSNSRLNLYSDHPMSKNKRVDELKELEVEKLVIGKDGSSQGNTIINNVDTSNTTNKTEYGSTNIGTKNADSTVTDYSNIN